MVDLKNEMSQKRFQGFKPPSYLQKTERSSLTPAVDLWGSVTQFTNASPRPHLSLQFQDGATHRNFAVYPPPIHCTQTTPNPPLAPLKIRRRAALRQSALDVARRAFSVIAIPHFYFSFPQ